MDAGEFVSCVVGWGSLDVQYAASFADAMGIDVRAFGSWLEDYTAQMGVSFLDIDIAAAVYEYVLQEMRNEVIGIMDFDILNDLEEEPYVWGNYLDTNYCEIDKLAEFFRAHREKLEAEGSYTLKQFIEHILGE